MKQNCISRVGLGYDLHRLVPDRKLILAGIQIPYEKGLAGHSDADVVLHAVIDAMLGAAGLEDIGQQFPDTDPAYKDIDSKDLLKITCEKVSRAGFTPVNLALTIIAESPKLKNYKPLMKNKLSELLGLPPHAVSVKAKTNETLGELGQGLAIACHAMISLTEAHSETI